MNSELFETNMAMFKSRMPKDLWDKVYNCKYIGKSITGNMQDGTLNVDVGKGPFYKKNAMTFAVEQVDNFCESPIRFNLMPTLEIIKDYHHYKVQGGLGQFLKEADISNESDGRTGYMVLFGFSLGLHTLLLMQKFNFKNLIIVEPKPEFIALSMHILQWTGLIRVIEVKGGTIEFISHDDPNMSASLLLAALKGPDYAIVDGTYLYRHYEDKYMDELIENLTSLLKLLPNSMGFVEDEYLMVKHAIENLKDNREYIFLNGSLKKIRQIPAFIVGSGPSIDKVMPAINRNKDNAIIFSGGTGLSVLLQHDILPDFHCEIENVPDIFEALSRLPKVGLLKKLILIAPTTIDPRVCTLFNNTIFYNRDSVVPTRFLSSLDEVINLAGPSVTNLACRSGISMGFPEFLLCGVDLGSAKKDTHHSKSSIYGTDESEYWQSGAGIEAFDIKIPGNRRKHVYTNGPLLLARTFFERLLSICEGQKFFNLSDGAEILHAQTVNPKDTKISKTFIVKEKHVENIMKELPRKSSKDLNIRHKTNIFQDHVNDWYDKVFAILEDRSITNFDIFYEKIKPLLQQGQYDAGHSYEAAARAMVSGSVIMMLQAGNAYINRVGEDKKLSLLLELIRLMRIELKEMQIESMQIITNSINKVA